jgi:hypothetical protein
MARSDVVQISGTTPQQRATWREAAGGGARDLSGWLRRVADRAASRQADSGLTRQNIDALTTTVTALLAQIGRGPGNALNQIARSLNVDIAAGRKPSAAQHLAALAAAADELRAIRSQLDDALDRFHELRP